MENRTARMTILIDPTKKQIFEDICSQHDLTSSQVIRRLMRQYIMTIPREMDEAAQIDGAGPIRILWSMIIPQCKSVMLAVALFHLVFAWNDYFGPLIYLSTNREAWPISVALSMFNGIYGQKPQLIQAGSLMTLIAPLILFAVAQKFFVQGIVITGVEK